MKNVGGLAISAISCHCQKHTCVYMSPWLDISTVMRHLLASHCFSILLSLLGRKEKSAVSYLKSDGDRRKGKEQNKKLHGGEEFDP